MNKRKYAVVAGDEILGIVYEDEEYGRTIVMFGKVDFNNPVKLMDMETTKTITESNFVKFIVDMLPAK